MHNPTLAREQWARYVYSRDTGHRNFIDKANRCEDFFAGSQWDESVVSRMKAVRRPTLTINTILSTMSSIFGEQIDLATEVAFKPRYSAPPQNAEVLTKTFKFISDDNQLAWLREEVFSDGCITSRGYYDVRLKFDKNTAGEVLIGQLNPRTVLPDPDGYMYDPDNWNDVIVTSWVTADEIELMYNDKAAADALRVRAESCWPHGYDSMDTGNDRFGGNVFAHMNLTETTVATTNRGIRVIDRQHKVLSRVKFFVNRASGDKMRVPDQWSEAEIKEQVAKSAQAGIQIDVTSELIKRVRWTVTAEDFVLHDDWSPFHRFTIVPFFPHFRYGRTIGIVEQLIDPQELLNKALSQELHIVNTMANSGWKVRKGALMNMEIDELEERGAETGIILEVNGDPEKDIVKITPNQIPQGLDRLSFKAEQYVKLVSNRGNNQMGMTRPDQSGKLTEESNKASDVSLKKILRNFERSDWLLARSVLEIVQNFYTDRRLMHITADDLTGAMEPIEINLPDPENPNEILNDMSLGTYSIVISSQKQRRTLEENEMADAVELRKAGVMIPDRFLIENSNLRKKADIVKAMDAAEQSPENQIKKKSEVLAHQLQVSQLKGEVSNLEAQASQHRAKTALTLAQAKNEAAGEPDAQAEMELEQHRHDQEMAHKREAHQMEMEHKRESHHAEMEQKRLDAHEKRRSMRIESMARAKAAASAKPAPGAGGAAPAAPARRAA